MLQTRASRFTEVPGVKSGVKQHLHQISGDGGNLWGGGGGGGGYEGIGAEVRGYWCWGTRVLVPGYEGIRARVRRC